MIYDITEQSLTNSYDTFSRELINLYNNIKTEEDVKNQKELQKKISIINNILNCLMKLKTCYKKI